MSLEGERLGRYHLLRLLGSGGMGEVYLAEDARIGQQVAIKVIRNEGIAYPESESTRDAARLFEREAKAIARLDHPNILPLYGYGEETLHDMPLTYLVMPYRKEGTLAQWLRQRSSATLLTPTEVAPLVQQAAEALQHAHDQQVIHQDIKPTNFLIRLRGDQPDRLPDLLLADFGIAKLTSATASASQSIRGTPTYMAPEQWEGHPVPATDQYALAIMVYELLVGRPPFQGGPGQVMRQHFMTPPPAPSTLNARLSPAIDAVLLRALSKQPEERFPSVAAFAQAVREASQYSGELHATLSISRAEAETGVTRSIILPGGRQVSVSVPSGVSDGTTLRLEGHGTHYYEGGPAGPLVLTISTLAAESPLSSQQGSTGNAVSEPTPQLQASSIEDTQVPTVRAVSPPMLEPTLPASPQSSAPFAPTVLAAGTPAYEPTHLARPAQEQSPSSEPMQLAPSSPVRPGTVLRSSANKRSYTRRIVLAGLTAVVIMALAFSLIRFGIGHPSSTGGSSPSAGSANGSASGVVTEFPVPTANPDTGDITAGHDGNLWFTEIYDDWIGRISPSGSITRFPIPTRGGAPLGIASGPDGNIWFTESNGGKIGRISPSGTITEYSLPSGGAEEITVGPDDNLWFTEDTGGYIGRITPSGKVTEFPNPTPQSATGGIAAGPDRNLWFTDSGAQKIGRITLRGTITEFDFPPPPRYSTNPSGITDGPDGNLWFTESGGNRIGRIAPNGTITEFPIPTPSSSPDGIIAGPDGALWFAETSGGKIGRITTGGAITEFPLPAAQYGPAGITIGPDGNLWFTQGNEIGRMTVAK